MKASTQLIDDSTGVGYIQPLSCDEPEIFNFVINEHTIAFFWKPLAFFGQPKWCCDLRVRRPKTKACRPWKASTLVSSTAITGRQPSSRLLPPSPPAEKATAREDQAREASTGDWTGRCHFLDNRCEWPIKAAAESRPTEQTLLISRFSPGAGPSSDSPPRQDFAFNLSDKRCLCNTVGGRIGRIVEGCAAYRCAVTAAHSRALTMTNFARASLALVLRAVFGGAKSCALVNLFMICPPVGSCQSTTAKFLPLDRGYLMAIKSSKLGTQSWNFGSQIERVFDCSRRAPCKGHGRN